MNKKDCVHMKLTTLPNHHHQSPRKFDEEYGKLTRIICQFIDDAVALNAITFKF